MRRGEGRGGAGEEEKRKSVLKSGSPLLQAIKTAYSQSSEQSNKYWLANGDSPSIGTIPIRVKKQRRH